MKIYLKVFLAVTLSSAMQLCAQAPDTMWTRIYGGYTTTEFGLSGQQTADGGYIVAGFTRILGPSYSFDIYIVKTDAWGDTLWTRTLSGSSDDFAYSILQTTDGGYIVAGSYGLYGGNTDVYVVKLDTLGYVVWEKLYGSLYYDYGQCVQQTSDNGYIVAGYTKLASDGYYDMYLLKLDSLGDTLWTKTYGGDLNEWAYSVRQTQDGGYIIVGFTESFAVGNYDVYIVKTDSLGDTLWTKTYGDRIYDEGFDVLQTPDKGYMILGYTEPFGSDNSDVYLIRTDSLGDSLWTRTYGGSQDDQGHAIHQTIDSRYIIAGTTDSYGAGSYDMYLLKIDSLGDTLWTKTCGATNAEYGMAVQQTADSGYIVFGGSNSFGISQNAFDVYLVKLYPDQLDVDEQENHVLPTESPIINVYPNPFQERINIDLIVQQSAHPCRVQGLAIYDATGRLIKSFDLQSPIYNLQSSMVWDGRDNINNPVPAGIYFCRIKADGYNSVEKIIKAK